VSEAHDALLIVYKAGVKAEIRRTRAAGPSQIGVEGLPKSIEADKLNWMMWEAATRDAIPLFDGENIYEKHVDALTIADAKEAAAFCFLAGSVTLESSDELFFVGDVLEGLEELEVDDA
jgi:hypothetical protein